LSSLAVVSFHKLVSLHLNRITLSDLAEVLALQGLVRVGEGDDVICPGEEKAAAAASFLERRLAFVQLLRLVIIHARLGRESDVLVATLVDLMSLDLLIFGFTEPVHK